MMNESSVLHLNAAYFCLDDLHDILYSQHTVTYLSYMLSASQNRWSTKVHSRSPRVEPCSLALPAQYVSSRDAFIAEKRRFECSKD